MYYVKSIQHTVEKPKEEKKKLLLLLSPLVQILQLTTVVLLLLLYTLLLGLFLVLIKILDYIYLLILTNCKK